MGILNSFCFFETTNTKNPMLENFYLLLFLFFIIAVLYSSVGFGGGSGYLAILALTSMAFTEIRTTALLCNILVVSGNSYMFQKQKAIVWKKIIPLVLFSIPFSFLGGKLKISQSFFFILLGFTLLFAAVSMFISKINSKPLKFKEYKIINAGFGSVIGFISGMVGIGGGVFLAPVLHLTNWDTPKKIAATASVFILLNSIAGLIGQSTNSDFTINWQLTSVLLVTVFIGSQIGNRLRNNYFSPILLKKATALLIAFVGIRILWKYLFL